MARPSAALAAEPIPAIRFRNLPVLPFRRSSFLAALLRSSIECRLGPQSQELESTVGVTSSQLVLTLEIRRPALRLAPGRLDAVLKMCAEI